MWTYNTTPRKSLGFITPLAALAKSMGVTLEIQSSDDNLLPFKNRRI